MIFEVLHVIGVSYLSDWTQCVECNLSKSSSKHVKCGVARGSLLAPLFSNEYQLSSERFWKGFFVIFRRWFKFIQRNSDEQISEMNTEIKLVTEWLTLNKLSLNLDKIHHMLFRANTGHVM